MVKIIHDYSRNGDTVVDVAILKDVSLMNTRLLPGAGDLPVTTWELYLNVETYHKREITFNNKVHVIWEPLEAFIISESLVNTENYSPHEYLNPDMLDWFTSSEIDNLRERIIWIECLPMTIDIDIEATLNSHGDRKIKWSVEEIEQILAMSSIEVETFKKNWEKKKIYKKFGL